MPLFSCYANHFPSLSISLSWYFNPIRKDSRRHLLFVCLLFVSTIPLREEMLGNCEKMVVISSTTNEWPQVLLFPSFFLFLCQYSIIRQNMTPSCFFAFRLEYLSLCCYFTLKTAAWPLSFFLFRFFSLVAESDRWEKLDGFHK